jgi:hypothetical protein
MERATTVGRHLLFGEESLATVKLLKKLGATFLWEVRALYTVPFGIALYMFGFQDMALWYCFCICILVFFSDGLFSVLVTSVFLKPIFHALAIARDGNTLRTSTEYQHMQKRKWSALIGYVL